MKGALYVLVVIVINKNGALGINEDYYWREYTGVIPRDAIPGGKDMNGGNTYIGQAFLKDRGLIVAQIYPGFKEVYVPSHGAKKTSTGTKILCSLQENYFAWLPVNGSRLHLDLIGRHAVIGGLDSGNLLHIGRISYQGEVKVGKISSTDAGEAIMFFIDHDKERTVKSFEILIYNSSSNNLLSRH